MSEATMKSEAVSQAVAMLETRAMFYRPPDIEEAQAEWKASCGPCALAAIMRRPVMAVEQFFPEFPGYTNGKTMLRALELAGLSSTMEIKGAAWPEHGLCWIGFKGPWSVMGFHIRIKYSHWVAVRTIAGSTVVWDVNVNAWAHKSVWERAVLPQLLERYKKATGEYEVFRGIEVKG
jgi:hypothetical protein